MQNEDQNRKSYAETLKIPLIVGVTGHIDISTPEEDIKAAMETFWGKLRKAAGEETPIILLSSIARGADHLTVKYRPEGVRYCVVLPFAENEYRKDFSGTDLTDFENDLRGAYKVITCPAEPGDYTLASDYVRRHADVLLTLWDGYECLDLTTRKAEPGGTYYQIREAFGMDDLLVHHQEKAHLIVNIPVTRSRKNPVYHQERSEKQFSGFEMKNLSVIEQGKAGKEDLIFTPFSNYDLLNGSDKSGSASFGDALNFMRKHNENLAAPEKPNYLRDGMKDFSKAMEIVSDDFNRHEYFDSLAMQHQTPHKKQFFRIAVCSIIVATLGQAWGDLTFAANETIHEWILHGVIAAYVLGCFGVFLLGRKIARDDHYTEYINPRVIAELLRLKIFWTLAGIKESFTDYIFDENASYLFMLPLCNWEIADTPLSELDRQWLEAGNGLAAVKNCWLDDQAMYYKGYLLPVDPKHFILPQEGEKCKKKKFLSPSWFSEYFKKYERLEGYSLLFKKLFTRCGFILAILLIAVFVLANIRGFDHTQVLALSWYREFIIGICPFAVAVLGWLMEKNNWDSLGRQYRNICELFEKAGAFVGDETKSVADKRQMVKEMAQFAHEENAEWQDIRRNARPEPML